MARPAQTDPVIDWLLAGDPAIPGQVQRDLRCNTLRALRVLAWWDR